MDVPLVNKLSDTPLQDLNLGDARLQRQLVRAGYKTILEVFDENPVTIDQKFGYSAGNTIDAWLKDYEADGEAFAKKALTKPEPKVETVAPAPKPTATEQTRAQKIASPVERKPVASSRQNWQTKPKHSYFAALPNEPYIDSLKAYEGKAWTSLRVLADHDEFPLAYQCFDEYTTSFDDIIDCFKQLFSDARFTKREALSLIDKYFKSIFIIFVAYLVSVYTHSHGAWDKAFEEIGINDTNIQNEFKRLFIKALNYKGMPIYEHDEVGRYYLSTAMMHGGFSEVAWESLWEDSLLPLATVYLKNGNYDGYTNLDGRFVLSLIKGNITDAYKPSSSVLTILKKIPEATIASIFDDGFRVALQASELSTKGSTATVLNKYDLTDAAMQSLIRVRTGATAASQHGHGASGSSKTKRLVYLPKAVMSLDVGAGEVHIKWPAQQFPKDYASYRVDIYINGEKQLEKQFDFGVGKCILTETDITVEPREGYSVELALMEEKSNNRWEREDSCVQSFVPLKPNCFEFIKDASGAYQLRKQSEHIKSQKEIAYLLPEGYELKPGEGIEFLDRYELAETWNGYYIACCLVSPCAAGSIVNTAAPADPLVWQEDFTVVVDKKYLIGKDASGLDLYGLNEYRVNFNSSLPSITIEILANTNFFEVASVSCTCDGVSQAVEIESLWKEDAVGVSKKFALRLNEVVALAKHVECCVIEIRNRKNNSLVFRYRFGVIPIRQLGLDAFKRVDGTFMATYCFAAAGDALVSSNAGGLASLKRWDTYSFDIPLAAENIEVALNTSNPRKSTTALLNLAGVEVEVPQRLLEINQERPLCLHDALDITNPSDSTVVLRVKKRQEGRIARLCVGGISVFSKVLEQPGNYEINVFARKMLFVIFTDKPQERSIDLALGFGRLPKNSEGKLEMPSLRLMDACEGLGFTDWCIVPKYGSRVDFVLDKPTLHDMQIAFKVGINDAPFLTLEMAAGEYSARVPNKLLVLLNAKQRLIMEITPKDFFDYDETYRSAFNLKKEF